MDFKWLNSKQKRISTPEERFVNDILTRVEKFLINELFVDEGSKVLLAVSGGIDSVVMLDIFSELSEKYNFQLSVAHYNHCLRGKNSDEDESFVKSISDNYSLKCYCAKGRVREYAKKNSLTIEQSARILRYLFLNRIASTKGSTFIATAHTLNDSAETLLFNLMRGSGLTGLSGIPPRRKLGKTLTIIRPLINLTKEEVIGYARYRNLSWREDETNTLLYYTRNKIRHTLIPLIKEQFNPSIIETLNRTARLISSADKLIQGQVERSIDNLIEIKNGNYINLKLPLLKTFDEFIQGELFHYILSKYFQIPFITQNIIQGLNNLIDSSVGNVFWINNQLHCIRDRNVLVFARVKDTRKVNLSIEKVGEFEINGKKLILKKLKKRNVRFSQDKNVEYFDYDLVPQNLIIRTWETGDSFVPLGMSGTVKVSDFLTNNKVSTVDRANVLVLTAKQEIIWVLGHRISNKFKITDKTEKILKADFKDIYKVNSAKKSKLR